MANNNYFAHNSPTYGTVGNMLDHFGYDWMGYGENIAKGYTTAETVVRGWISSTKSPSLDRKTGRKSKRM
jgi:uncharacterized protein YkwD